MIPWYEMQQNRALSIWGEDNKNFGYPRVALFWL